MRLGGQGAEPAKPLVKRGRAEVVRQAGAARPRLDLRFGQFIAGGPGETFGKALERGLDTLAAGTDHGLEALAREGQRARPRERAQKRRRNHRTGLACHLLHVEGDEAAHGSARRGVHSLGIGDRFPGLLLLGHRIGAMGGGDEQRLVGRGEAAQHGAARLHEFRRDHHIDVTRCRHERQDGRVAIPRRQHLDVVERGAGALGDARHGG